MECCGTLSTSVRRTRSPSLSRGATISRDSSSYDTPRLPRLSLQLRRRSRPVSYGALNSPHIVGASEALRPTPLVIKSTEPNEGGGTNWDKLGYGLVETENMYVMKCDKGGTFSDGGVEPLRNIELSPSAGVLSYGQGLFEGLKAYRKHDGTITLFRPEENARRMIGGAYRMCMPAPTVDQFVGAVKATVLANEKWIPPYGKGSLYVRPLLIGTGPVLGIAPSPEYTFLVYVSPIGNYFKGAVEPIDLVVETKLHRTPRGGAGAVKAIGNYSSTLRAQCKARQRGYSDVIYTDPMTNINVEGISSCNIFIVKISQKMIFTPALDGSVLPGITRASVIDVARSLGYTVNECELPVDEFLQVEEVFCTGTAVGMVPVHSITYCGEKLEFGRKRKEDGTWYGVGKATKHIYEAFTSIQMGLSDDTNNWLLHLN